MQTKRLLALDVLRGLTLALMILVNNPGSWSFIYPPLQHSAWNGCTPTDLVFPFFLFIVGVSIWYSFKKYGDGITKKALLKVLKRFLVIFLLGVFLNGFPYFDFENLRIYGVLQRIAITYAIAAVLCMQFSYKQLLVVLCILLFGYWAIIYFGGTENAYSLTTNIVRKTDLLLLGEKHIYGGYGIPFDPEGLLSSIPSVATVLIGYFTGIWIEKSTSVIYAVRKLILIGTVSMVIGLIWNLFFPINKPLWSSSYVLFTSGIAMLILALLLWFLDVKEIKKWANPFVHFGMNPLFIYVISGLFSTLIGLVEFTNSDGKSTTIHSFLYNDVFVPIGGYLNGSLFFALFQVLLFWVVAYILFKIKIFIKI